MSNVLQLVGPCGWMVGGGWLTANTAKCPILQMMLLGLCDALGLNEMALGLLSFICHVL